MGMTPHSDTPARKHGATGRRLTAIALVVALVGVTGVINGPRRVVGRVAHAGSTTIRDEPFGARSSRWTKLPLPPEVRDGAVFVATKSHVLAWGGCNPATKEDCDPTADGFQFDAATRTWSALPPAPSAGAYWRGVWTGTEAIFFDVATDGRLGGLAYDPASATWRSVSVAPISARRPAALVWTGAEVIVWGGGGPSSHAPKQGAAYDPAADTWRRIADAPIGLNLASGMWTGDEMLVFGSLLDRRNRAATKFSVGAAYDPAADEWRKLPRSNLSPQATSAVWLGGRMVAWDYEVRSQEYDPVSNTWTSTMKMPFRFDECYPDSVVVRDLVFAFFCGRAALYDVDTHTWTQLHGGPLRRTIEAHGRRYRLWRFAHLVSLGEVVHLLMEGITVSKRGVPCYGCHGTPNSFWAYSPPVPTEGSRVDRNATIRLNGAPTEVDAGDGAVWVAHSNGHGGFQISRVDSSTNAVRSEPIGGRPSSLEVGPSGVWLGLDGVGLSGSIVRIDSSTMDETLRVRLDARVIDLALGGGALWANGNDGLLRRIDLTTGDVTPTPSPGNGAIDWGSDGLWVTDITGSLMQLTSDLERSGSSIDVGPNVVGINSGEGVVWLTQQRPDGTFAVVAVDNAIRRVVHSVPLELGPGALDVSSNFVWVPQNGASDEGGNGAVARIEASTGQIGGPPIPVGSGPTNLAVVDGALWVSNFSDHTLSRVDV
jgi:DNA-binding beta-propeller fold protein YncE